MPQTVPTLPREAFSTFHTDRTIVGKELPAAAEYPLDDCFMAEGERPLPDTKVDCYLVDGELKQWTGKMAPVYTPIRARGSPAKVQIGAYAMLTEAQAAEAVDSAARAWDNGRGEWAQSSVLDRIAAMEKFLDGLRGVRDRIVELLMWEICKNAKDAANEVDRTVQYIEATIGALKTLVNEGSTFNENGGVVAQIRRSPLGVVMCAGPFNYPFNETYALLIPALIMGNCVVVKIPRVGVLCHRPTFELFRDCFPKGVVNIVSGSGRETMPPIMSSGKLDGFGFIGTSDAADDLMKAHPAPHRLRAVLGMEAKNPGIVLRDANLDLAVSECLLGSLSFNGQRCTAIKIIFVHEAVADAFVEKFAAEVDKLKLGTPWDKDTKITPLPEEAKPAYLKGLIEDAVGKGAKIVNKKGGVFDRTLVTPTVLYNVTPDMKVMHEEQFGPVVPIARWSSWEDVDKFLAESKYGQQAALFGNDPAEIGPIVDSLVNQVARVNLNAQCQRGPDVFPFNGRKSSAIGTLSISDALKVFSIRTMVATKVAPRNTDLLSGIVKTGTSQFVSMNHLF
ncbi:aldehyde dehydrogenase family protein [Hyaloraphidium curvatum]|nr:aldehyde dehydrogenase family protein [Hyaloraphidium curvatum]